MENAWRYAKVKNVFTRHDFDEQIVTVSLELPEYTEVRPNEVFEAMSKAVGLMCGKEYIAIPETGIDDLSDGFHTFRQLYYQRMMLFSALVRQNRDMAWKSWKHEDGACFGGGWFIVGIDTPEGSYTYHFEEKDWDLFDCVELPVAKHWDGHTEKDVARLLSLSSVQPEIIRCKDCKYCDSGIDEDGKPFLKCLGWVYGGTQEDDFCSHAERRRQ